MKNKFIDLINHNFMALERLNQDGLSPEEIKIEVVRAKAVADVSTVIINGYGVALEANRQVYEGYASAIPHSMGIEEK